MMDPFHERLARVALRVGQQFGFCLAGGYALQAHNMVDRQSEDVDLFTTADIGDRFSEALRAVTQALADDNLSIVIDVEYPTFARLLVADPTNGQKGKLELGVDWRAYPPVQLSVGPVLHPDDAVANKVCALYSRGAVRDYIDVHGAIVSGRYRKPDVLQLAANHDPGFEPSLFAEALAAAARLPNTAFASYKLSDDDAAAMRDTLVAWAAEIRGGG